MDWVGKRGLSRSRQSCDPNCQSLFVFHVTANVSFRTSNARIGWGSRESLRAAETLGSGDRFRLKSPWQQSRVAGVQTKEPSPTCFARNWSSWPIVVKRTERKSMSCISFRLNMCLYEINQKLLLKRCQQCHLLENAISERGSIDLAISRLLVIQNSSENPRVPSGYLL